MYCKKLLVVAVKAGRYRKRSVQDILRTIKEQPLHLDGVKGSTVWGVLRQHSFSGRQAWAERSVGELSRFSRPWYEQRRGSNTWEAEVNGTESHRLASACSRDRRPRGVGVWLWNRLSSDWGSAGFFPFVYQGWDDRCMFCFCFTFSLFNTALPHLAVCHLWLWAAFHLYDFT